VICLAAGAVVVALAGDTMTLVWTHSVEKTRWEEDWRLEGGALVARAARVRGSGAGMEPPAGARLAAGAWHYRPTLPPQQRLTLARSSVADDYELCDAAGCRPLADRLPGGDGAVVEIAPCAVGASAASGDGGAATLLFQRGDDSDGRRGMRP
jgi:hypothetical protein